MSSLEYIEQPNARAIVAPDFAASLRELGALDSASWSAHFDDSRPQGEGRRPIAMPTLEGGTDLVLRRFHHGGSLAHILGATLRSPRRLFDEFRVHYELATRGTPVPQPAFAVAHRAGARWTGGIATVRIPDAVDGFGFLEAGPSSTNLGRCVEAAGHALRSFHDAGGRHADLHIANLLVRQRDAIEVFVIDLDRARIGPPPSIARRAREIGRLGRSLHKRGLQPDPIDTAAVEQFLSAYADHDPAGLRTLRTRLRFESLRTAVHRAGYALRPRRATPHGGSPSNPEGDPQRTRR